jgi:hypothetical protein
MLIEAMLSLVLAQEGEKKAPAKEPAAPGPMLRVEEVDTNGDGWISGAELKAAFGKLGGGAKEGGVKKPGPKDGEGVKKGPREGDAPKKPGPRDGEAPKKEGPKDGEK